MPISHCRGCEAPLPTPFLDLGSTPLANSYIRPADASMPEPRYVLAVAYCPHCHLVQLTETIPPEALFTEYLYFSSYSDSYVLHAKDMTESLCRRFSLNESSFVVEIASNDGYLLRHFQERHVPVLGVEPAQNIARRARENGIPTLNRFFGEELVPEILDRYRNADLILGNNVFAHVPAINSFLRAIYDCLAPGGYAVLQFPTLADLIAAREFDTIYHEHVFYYSLTAVDLLARRAGLTLANVEYHEVHGGSARVFLSKTPREPSQAVSQWLERERSEGLTRMETFYAFAIQVRNVRDGLLELLHDLKRQGRSIAAYGAPAKGNTLLNYCDIGRDLIEFTVDRSPHKQGLLLPGSRIPILAPEHLLGMQPDYTLMLPWNMTHEIVGQQQEYVQRGGRFILPIPSPTIIQPNTLAASRKYNYAVN